MKKMRNIGRISLLVSIFLFCINPVASAQTNLFLDVNQSQYLNAGGSITRVAVANPEIADIKVISPEEMLLIAKKAGTTSLYIWTDTGMRQEFSLSVQDADSQTAAVITRLIACPQVGVEKLGDKVLLHGIVANQLHAGSSQRVDHLHQGVDIPAYVAVALRATPKTPDVRETAGLAEPKTGTSG